MRKSLVFAILMLLILQLSGCYTDIVPEELNIDRPNLEDESSGPSSEINGAETVVGDNVVAEETNQEANENQMSIDIATDNETLENNESEKDLSSYEGIWNGLHLITEHEVINEVGIDASTIEIGSSYNKETEIKYEKETLYIKFAGEFIPIETIDHRFVFDHEKTFVDQKNRNKSYKFWGDGRFTDLGGISLTLHFHATTIGGEGDSFVNSEFITTYDILLTKIEE